VLIPCPDQTKRWILTNAHCVDHDDDDGDNEIGESVTAGAGAGGKIDRVGRWKSIFRCDGSVFAAVCVAFNEESDVAIFEAPAVAPGPSSDGGGGGASPVGAAPFSLSATTTAPLARAAAPEGTTVVCVGNPGDKTYHRFFFSDGKIIGPIDPAVRRRSPELGGTRHSCWTSVTVYIGDVVLGVFGARVVV
jgi:hypothetical protein